jgi:hypothetical protein
MNLGAIDGPVDVERLEAICPRQGTRDDGEAG